MAEFSSSFGVGDRCLFQPNINKVENGLSIDPYSAIECEITEVIFSSAKVYYSIKVRYHEQGRNFWVPIQRVDSLTICPLDEVSSSD